MSSSDDAVKVIGPLEEAAVRDVWPKVEGYLASALATDDWKVTPSDLLRQIGEGVMGLYVVQDFSTGELIAALACEVQEYPQSNVFNIAYCGGHSLYRWAPLIGEMESEAVRLGCDRMRITGRPGWGRVFPDYREMHRVFERKVVVNG